MIFILRCVFRAISSFFQNTLTNYKHLFVYSTIKFPCCQEKKEYENCKMAVRRVLVLIQVEQKFQSPILSFGDGDFGIETAKSKLRRKNF